MFELVHPRRELGAGSGRAETVAALLIEMDLDDRAGTVHVEEQLGARVGGAGVMGGGEQEGRGELLQLLAGRGAAGTVDHEEIVGLGIEAFDGVLGGDVAGAGRGGDRAGQRGASGEAGEDDLVRIDLELFGARADQAHGAVAVGDARRIAVARVEAVGEHEGGDAPVVHALGHFDTFQAIHQHDVGAPGGDDDGGAVGLAGRRFEDSEEGRVERAVARGAGNFAGIPEGDGVVGGFANEGGEA